MTKNKKVPVFNSFVYGFQETRKHLKILLPLSALLFVPELLQALGWTGTIQLIFKEVYKVAAFFFLLLMSVRLTRNADQAVEKKKVGLEFLKGNLLQWGAISVAFVLGAGLLALGYLYTDSPALIILDQADLIQGVKDYVAWLRIRPWVELALTTLVLGYLPYRIFVMFNFFGFIIVDTGAGCLKAFKLSRRLSRGVFWSLTLFYALCAALGYLGFKIYVVGAIFAFPVTVLATVYVYRSLAAQQAGR